MGHKKFEVACFVIVGIIFLELEHMEWVLKQACQHYLSTKSQHSIFNVVQSIVRD